MDSTAFHASTTDWAQPLQRPNMPASDSFTSYTSSSALDSPELEKMADCSPILLSQTTQAATQAALGKGRPRHKRKHSNKAHIKTIRRVPWVSSPVSGTEEVWLEKEQEATEWLSLFYDLVVVAVLTIFSTQHELATPAAIPTFLSFFVIIFWLWVSQTAFDMRFQGDDALNRFFKFLQIGLFIYQGAAGKNWKPSKIEMYANADPFGTSTTEHRDALQSFTTVGFSFAVSRGILALQYAICWIQGRRAGRKTKYIAVNVAVLIVSMGLAVAAVCLPATSTTWKIAKLACFYSSIGIEVINVFLAILLGGDLPLETHKVAERYGAFTLIVIGEGFISVTKAFSKAISGFSKDESATYVQVFLTILILFLLYSFLFGSFDKNDHTGHGRAILWQILHFPLCFGMLLLIAAMVNVVITISSTHGIALIIDLLDPFSQAIYSGVGTALDPKYLAKVSIYMNKLALDPPFAPTMTSIFDSLNQTNPTTDAQIVYTQYVAQIAYSVFQKYGTEIPIGATDMYYDLLTANSTWTEDATDRANLRATSLHTLVEIVQEIVTDAFSGVLWLLPVAGCVLILIACRSMLWYRFTGAAHWIHHGSQLFAGVSLGLLGLLNIGSKQLDLATLVADGAENTVNPLYRVLFREIPLVIIAAVYFVVYVGSGAAIWFWQHRQDKRERAKEMIVASG